MNRKNFLILFTSVFSLLLIISVVLMKTGVLVKEQEWKLIEVIEEDRYVNRTEPLVVESLISGRIIEYPTREKVVTIDLTEEDAQEIVNLLSNTKVKRTSKKIQPDVKTYYISLNNNGYTMPYQINVSLKLQLNEEESGMIFDTVETYETEDLKIYYKLIELFEKNQ